MIKSLNKLIENMKKVRRSWSMPKITVYANYEFINDSDNCYDNGELSILYMVVYHVSELYDYVE